MKLKSAIHRAVSRWVEKTKLQETSADKALQESPENKDVPLQEEPSISPSSDTAVKSRINTSPTHRTPAVFIHKPYVQHIINVSVEHLITDHGFP